MLRRLYRISISLLFTLLGEITFAIASPLAYFFPRVWIFSYLRWVLLTSISKTRLRLRLPKRADVLACEAIELAQVYPDDWNVGNAIHQGNTVRGLVALRRNDVAAAKAFLLASGKTLGSPQLESFGPSMKLADALLRVDEKDAVLDYFNICAVFWDREFSQLDRWAREIRQGKQPNFGPNLLY